MIKFYFALIALTGFMPTLALAGEADVVGVKISNSGSGVYRFDVSVAHGDEGWDHYANKWDIVGPDGTVLGTRVLLHPHVGEQPFTRSLGGVEIPTDVQQVSVRAHDLVHCCHRAELAHGAQITGHD